MTETEWLTGTNPVDLLGGLPQPLNDRKLRLWMTACHRRLWPLLTPLEQRMPEATELFLEGQLSQAAFDTVFRENPLTDDDHAPTPAEYNLTRALNEVEYVFDYSNEEPEEQSAALAELVREIFGNPFQPITLDAAWLTGRDGMVARLAQAVYDHRQLPGGLLDPERLEILADALEEAGCTESVLLTHLRSPGPHVLGCWVVDLLLGKLPR